ncbi:MAG: hypothetical protein AB7G28_26205 [Pirellulales bacterium]
MAHEVRVKSDVVIVGHKDVEIVVSDNGEKLGTILVSKGNIEWLPRGNSVNKRRLSWAKFADFMEMRGKPVKKR